MEQSTRAHVGHGETERTVDPCACRVREAWPGIDLVLHTHEAGADLGAAGTQTVRRVRQVLLKRVELLLEALKHCMDLAHVDLVVGAPSGRDAEQQAAKAALAKIKPQLR